RRILPAADTGGEHRIPWRLAGWPHPRSPMRGYRPIHCDTLHRRPLRHPLKPRSTGGRDPRSVPATSCRPGGDGIGPTDARTARRTDPGPRTPLEEQPVTGEAGASGASELRASRRALARGDWAAARMRFEAMLERQESAEALDGLAVAAWWLGDVPRLL